MIPVAKPIIGREEIRAVKKVMKSASLAQGLEVRKFEENFSKLVGGRFCVAVNSGTSALHLALLSLGVGTGDEVIVPSFTFAATANTVALTGATPVFVDINPKTFNIDEDKLESAITPRTKAIQIVHLYGLPANMSAIMNIARKFGLLVVEDSAQAHLAEIDGSPVGTFGDAAAFSFYPTKNMTSGEGGIVVFKDEEHARLSRLYRNQGMERKYHNEIVGFNLRMTELCAAIGNAQIKKLNIWTEKRRENAVFLDEKLDHVDTPYQPAGFKHVYHQYTIRIPLARDKMSDLLTRAGIGNAIYYPIPVHLLPSFHDDIKLPQTELAAKEVLSLPVHPSLSKRNLHQIANTFNRLFEKCRHEC